MLVRIFSIISLLVFIVLMIHGATPLFAFIRGVITFILLIFSYQLFALFARAIGSNNDNKPTTKEDVTH